MSFGGSTRPDFGPSPGKPGAGERRLIPEAAFRERPKALSSGPEPVNPNDPENRGELFLSDYQKWIPVPTPETRHFWDGCRDGKLILQRCGDTGRAYFPPRPFSPYTGSRNVSVFEASGRGTLYSYVINQRPAKGFDAPYAIAIVQLPEGVRMMTNIVDCEQTPEALELDMPLEVCFDKIDDDISLPLWRPARG